MMNFLNLQYFLAAAEDLNFTRAAERLHISQQSLSNHVRRLEEHFDTPLFDRTPPMTLTPAGLALMRYVKSLQQSLNGIEAEIQDIRDDRSSELTLGITRARGAVYLPMILPKFTRTFPHMRVNLYEETSLNLERALRQGKMDLMMGRLPLDQLGITSVKVWDEHYVLLAPHRILYEYLPERADWLIANPTKVGLSDLAVCPFLSIREDLLVGTVFRNLCAGAGIMPRIVLESSSIDTMILLCMEGMGVMVCPDIFLCPHRDAGGEFKRRDLSVFPLPYSEEMAVSYLDGKYFSVGARRFTEMLCEVGRSMPHF